MQKQIDKQSLELTRMEDLTRAQESSKKTLERLS